ncbi:MAG TPA: PAS domain-containing sensor histidine kinase [candidate division Zixibacteria bacterium]|nr:PAS domain-containing sensor histidine kinase [candidate division Zixibacteria bacterium]
MADKTVETGIGFTRCAVCKIDLKGRFVYIDDKIENLLECTKENLFGRSITEFLDADSQDRINQLLTQRNHYESFFDATDITLIAVGSKPIRARAVVSLNYIAGNPVNFQLVCDTAALNSESSVVCTTDTALKDFVNDLINLDGRCDLKPLTAAFRRLAGARQASVYLFDGENLEPRAGATDQINAPFSFDSIPPAGPLHRQVAVSSERYDFTDQDDVRRAIELSGVAPNEFVAPLICDGHSAYLLRLLFEEETESEVACQAIGRINLGLELVARLFASDDDRDGDPAVDIKFTIGFLESLGIGAVLTQRDGAVVGYNSSAARLAGSDELGDDYHQFLDCLLSGNKEQVAALVKDHFEPSSNDTVQNDLRITVKAATGQMMDLVLIRLVFDPGDYSACFVMIPYYSEETFSGPGSNRNHDVWIKALTTMVSRVSLIEKSAGELGHVLFDQLGDEGNRSIEMLLESSRQLLGMSSDLSRLAEYERSQEEPAETDLKLLFKSCLDAIQPRFPNIAVTARCSDLPKIRTCRNKLRTIFGAVIDNSLRYCVDERLNLRLTCRAAEENWFIEITDNGPGIPRQYLSDIFEPYFHIPGRRPQSPPGNGRGLALIRALVESMQGDIEAESDGRSGTTIRIRLPRL